jgi:hypothetical protein
LSLRPASAAGHDGSPVVVVLVAPLLNGWFRMVGWASWCSGTQCPREFLHDQCSRIEDELERVSFALPSGPIHGDAFMGNLIAGAAGPAICDFDSACMGPREWDLTPVAVGKLRFDYPGDTYGELVSEYGFDVTLWPGFPTLRKIRELQLVSSVVPVLGGNPRLRDQWQYRLDTFRNRQESARWSAYR